MKNMINTSRLIKMDVVLIGMIVNSEFSEKDHLVSVAGNRFQLKLLKILKPDFFINIVPIFLESKQSEFEIIENQITLNSNIPGNRIIKILGKTIGDSLKYLNFLILKRKMIVILYNLDYTNVFLALLSRGFGHKTFIVAADFTSPATNLYQHFILWTYRQMNGVISLRNNNILNKNNTVMPAIIDFIDENNLTSISHSSILFSGSLGETTGLYLAIDAAIACPNITFIFTGRPFCISQQHLNEVIKIAISKGANIKYLGTLPFNEYIKILNTISIALSLRNPIDPDHENNFPSKIAEYMSTGKVVLSTLKYPELDDDTYIKIDYNVNSLIDKINELCKDPEKIKIISNRARFFVKERFSEQNSKEKIYRFIDNV